MTTKGSNVQGPFITGFVAGMAAGALGVYFFATERGKGFMEEMNELWEEARPELVKKGVIADTDATLGEAAKSFLIQSFAEKAQDLTAGKKRIRKTNTLFKGV